MSRSHDKIATNLIEAHRDEAIAIIQSRMDEWGGLSVNAEDHDRGGVVGFWDPDKVMDAVCRIHEKPAREATQLTEHNPHCH